MTKKEYRIKWIGFDDQIFMLIGIPLLAVVANALNYQTQTAESITESLGFYFISLSFCTLNWLGYRKIAVEYRKRYLDQKTETKRITAMILVSLVYFLVANPGWSFILENVLNHTQLGAEIVNFKSLGNLASPFVLSVMMIAIYEVIYFSTRLSQSEKQKEQIKAANTLSQLNALKNQSKPHFLFNSLNTLKYMISGGPSQNAINFIDELAAVYRYIISMGDEYLIPLSEELAFIESYLFVQKERFGDNLEVVMDVAPDYYHFQVAPMSIQQLIENAIKHNVVSSKRPLVINVSVDQSRESNYIVVSNRKAPKSAAEGSTKTGLKNIKSRYDLLSEKKVIIKDQKGVFQVKIPMIYSVEPVNVSP